MPGPNSFHVTLAADTADMLQERVASGAYASESDVIDDGLRMLQQRDVALETWLKTEVVAAHEEYHQDPSTGVPGNEIMDRLKTRYRGITEARTRAP